MSFLRWSGITNNAKRDYRQPGQIYSTYEDWLLKDLSVMSQKLKMFRKVSKEHHILIVVTDINGLAAEILRGKIFSWH